MIQSGCSRNTRPSQRPLSWACSVVGSLAILCSCGEASSMEESGPDEAKIRATYTEICAKNKECASWEEGIEECADRHVELVADYPGECMTKVIEYFECILDIPECGPYTQFGKAPCRDLYDSTNDVCSELGAYPDIGGG